MTLFKHYQSERKRFVEHCTQCGLCAKRCPILPHTDLRDLRAKEIQKGVHDFLNSGEPNSRAYTKAFACMACYKCTVDMCPEGLNPMLVNEWIKREYIARGLATPIYGDTGEADSPHRVLASVQVSAPEYTRITNGSRGTARYVFFPGCNIYVQPEKLLNAMDIMDAVGDDWAFLPGLAHCCGDSYLFTGDMEGGADRADDLVAAIAAFEPEAVILWCPTCHCRFGRFLSAAMDLPFEVLSFPRYLAANMDKLPLTQAAAELIVTLHEPCKSAYTGVDRDGPRSVLQRLPGVTLREMDRHGADTVCCGSGAICWFPESCDRIRTERLQEAARTGAERLVTVCHYCNQTFANEDAGYDFSVVSYVSLVAEAMGIRREDLFKKYMRWGNLDRILADAEIHISDSPFPEARIVEVLKAAFVK